MSLRHRFVFCCCWVFNRGLCRVWRCTPELYERPRHKHGPVMLWMTLSHTLSGGKTEIHRRMTGFGIKSRQFGHSGRCIGQGCWSHLQLGDCFQTRKVFGWWGVKNQQRCAIWGGSWTCSAGLACRTHERCGGGVLWGKSVLGCRKGWIKGTS